MTLCATDYLGDVPQRSPHRWFTAMVQPAVGSKTY